MPRFFIEQAAISGSRVVITGGDCAHITRVLRLGAGDTLELCDGRGTDYVGKIKSVGKDEVLLDIVSSCPSASEPALRVTLFQGLPKAAKMDYIIEKCVELGVHAIVPVITRRAVVKLDAQGAAKKTERWRHLAEAAAKQSGRGIVPHVEQPCALRDISPLTQGLDWLVVAYENEKQTHLREALQDHRDSRSVGIFIGPEGGFDFGEVEQLIACGARPVSLGNRILRTETAGHTVLTALLYEFGEF